MTKGRKNNFEKNRQQQISHPTLGGAKNLKEQLLALI